jgi:hypothetical protein
MSPLIPIAKGAAALGGLGLAGYAKGAYDAVKEALSDDDSKDKDLKKYLKENDGPSKPKKTKMR